MMTSNKICKNIAIGTVLAATGLTASLAQAQFKVEYKNSQASPTFEKIEKTEHRVIGISSDGGEHSYEIKIVNGTITLAKLDGKMFDHNHVQVKDQSVLFLGSDGKVLYEIELPAAASVGIASPTPPKPVRSITWLNNDDQTSRALVIATEQPKVMLGINLGEPSDAVRKQLRLGSDQQVILVEKVIEGLPAARAGVEDFDVILSIDGSDHANGELLREVMQKKNPGDTLKLVVLRGGEKVKVSAQLAAYSAEELGEITSITISRGDLITPAVPPAPRGGQWLGADVLPQIHEQLTQALNSAGLSADEIAKVHEQLQTQMGQIRSRFFSSDAGGSLEFSPEGEAEHRDLKIEREHAERGRFESSQPLALAEQAKDKARQAMRDAERQIMEMRDGRLIVRSAQRVENQMGAMEDRIASLESRLESQLESQMERFESQMERMSDLFERMFERLENRKAGAEPGNDSE